MCNNNVEPSYISFSEFQGKYGFKEKTIKKNCHMIPGALITDEGCKFLTGTRYPYNLRNAKLSDSAKKRYALMTAISKDRYIDHSMLKMEVNDFIFMLRQLIAAGWIEENDGCNFYGANKYSLTIDGERALDAQKKNKISTIASIAGIYTGAVFSQVYPPAA